MRTRGLNNDSHVDVSVLFFKPSAEQVIKLLNSFYNFLNKSSWIVLNWLYWSSADCRWQNWVGLRQFNAFVDWIFIGEPRFFKKPCRPATCVAENFRFGKVKVVARIHAVCCHEWHLNVAVSCCRSVLLKSGGELPRGLSCVITGIVLALDSAKDRGLLTRVGPVFNFHQSAA